MYVSGSGDKRAGDVEGLSLLIKEESTNQQLSQAGEQDRKNSSLQRVRRHQIQDRTLALHPTLSDASKIEELVSN